MHSVVVVVAPLGRQAVAIRLAGRDERGVVQVGFGDERQRAADVRAQRIGGLGEFPAGCAEPTSP